MRTIITIIFSIILSVSMAFGASITPDMAKKAAGGQLEILQISSQKRSKPDYDVSEMRPVTEKDGNIMAYVFILKPEGYIVVSPDTNIRPVIAYSLTGSFPFKDHPDNALLHMLTWDMQNRQRALPVFSEEYKKKNQILWEDYLNPKRRKQQRSDPQQWGPYLKTSWHQSSPYDKYCPIDPNTGERSAPGCIAISMAQIVNYWKYPSSITFDENDRYESGAGHIKIDEDHDLYDFPSFSELNQMLTQINYEDENTRDEDDIAALVFASGIASGMHYNSSGSPSNSNKLTRGLIEKFGYFTAAPIEFSDFQEDFYTLLKEDMKKGLPAEVSIFNSTESGAGHSIVADGFKISGEYSLNFGGGSGSSGIRNVWYFLPEDLKPGFDTVTGGTLNIYPYPTESELYYVNGGIEKSGDGLTWATAFKTIHEAVLSARGDAEIWVKQGTYKLDRTIQPIGRKIAFYGGFNGSETQKEQRDWQNNLTIIDGQNQVRCFINRHELILDGFVFSNGTKNDNYEYFYGDYRDDCGGVIYNYEKSITNISNCKFLGNTAKSRGGAIYNSENSVITIENCIFSNNISYTGGAIYNDESNIKIANGTFSGNSSEYGGAIYVSDSTATIINTILWGNTATYYGNEIYLYQSSTASVNHSNIQGGYSGEGEGNIDADPLFIDPENGDFRLQTGSPCIDTGSNDVAELPEKDLDGNSRIGDGNGDSIAVTDMGAYEYQCNPDCNGVCHGTAYIDNCENCVGGNTGKTACIQDCNGDWGGTAFTDNCGQCVGGNTGKNACTQDCNSDWGGNAFTDNCSQCVGGNTGKIACIQDCNGDWGGNAFTDNCGQCVGGNTGKNACIQDCNGDWGGTAFTDGCGDCAGGNTGKEACPMDCNGDLGGIAFIDNCSECVGGNTGKAACVQDCNGDWGGTAYLDKCGQCVSGNTGKSPCIIINFTTDANGSITGEKSQTPESGGNCTLVKAVPNEHYEFIGWTGDYTGTDNPLTLTNVIKDMNIKANFALAATLSVTPVFHEVSGISGLITFDIANTDTGTMEWIAVADADWLNIESQNSGTNNASVTVSYDKNAGEERIGTITITSPNAKNSPQIVEVRQKSPCNAQAFFVSTFQGLSAYFNTEGSVGKLFFDYGDNKTGTEAEHTYTQAGTYEVTLTTTVSSECKKTVSKTVIINPILPTLATAKATKITTTSAYTGGFVLENGGVPITVRGICWSLSLAPTLEKNDGVLEYTTAGTGEFRFTITNLTPDTSYYVSAFATNSVETAYGRAKAFRTLSAALPGDVNNDGTVGLQDAILALKIISGTVSADNIRSDADVNGDDKIGIEEVIYILRQVVQAK